MITIINRDRLIFRDTQVVKNAVAGDSIKLKEKLAFSTEVE